MKSKDSEQQTNSHMAPTTEDGEISGHGQSTGHDDEGEPILSRGILVLAQKMNSLPVKALTQRNKDTKRPEESVPRQIPLYDNNFGPSPGSATSCIDSTQDVLPEGASHEQNAKPKFWENAKDFWKLATGFLVIVVLYLVLLQFTSLGGTLPAKLPDTSQTLQYPQPLPDLVSFDTLREYAGFKRVSDSSQCMTQSVEYMEQLKVLISTSVLTDKERHIEQVNRAVEMINDAKAHFTDFSFDLHRLALLWPERVKTLTRDLEAGLSKSRLENPSTARCNQLIAYATNFHAHLVAVTKSGMLCEEKLRQVGDALYGFDDYLEKQDKSTLHSQNLAEINFLNLLGIFVNDDAATLNRRLDETRKIDRLRIRANITLQWTLAGVEASRMATEKVMVRFCQERTGTDVPSSAGLAKEKIAITSNEAIELHTTRRTDDELRQAAKELIEYIKESVRVAETFLAAAKNVGNGENGSVGACWQGNYQD